MACEYIIIVDDEREIGKLLVEALQIRGYEADHFDNPDILLKNTELKDLLADSALIITDRTMCRQANFAAKTLQTPCAEWVMQNPSSSPAEN